MVKSVSSSEIYKNFDFFFYRNYDFAFFQKIGIFLGFTPFPHDKNEDIKIVIGIYLFLVLSLPLLHQFLTSFEFIILL